MAAELRAMEAIRKAPQRVGAKGVVPLEFEFFTYGLGHRQ